MRFGVDVAIESEGPLRPGAPTRYLVTVTPTADYADLSVNIYSPEVDFARKTGWDGSYQVVRGEVTSLTERALGAVSRGRPVQIRGEVSIEAEGAYELIVETTGQPTADGGIPILPSSHHSVWLFVDQEGGTISSAFDPALFPQDAFPLPGPRRNRSGGAASSPASQSSFSSTTAKVHLYYSHGGVTHDVPGSLVQVDELDGSFNVVDTEYEVTDANGVATFYCDEFFLDIHPHLWGSEVVHLAFAFQVVGGVCTSPTVTHSINVGAPDGHSFLKLEDEIIPGIESVFGKGRHSVNLAVSAGTDGSFYTGFWDRITLDSVGAFSDFVMAHEFGHAWQEKAAGGNHNSGQCNGRHYFDADSGYRCALSEGFANFAALISGFDTARIDDTKYINQAFTDSFRTTLADSAFLGVEGAITYFLDDVFDADNGEAYDDLYVSPAYVDEIFSSCKADNTRATRVHYLIHCIEKGISGYTLGFPPIDEPSSYSVSSGHSVDALDLRALWRWHFFNSTDTVPPPPSPPTVSLFGPTSVKPSTTCAWFASASGTGTLSYAWYRNSTLQGSTTDEALIATGTSSFDVSVVVTDGWGQFDADTLAVTVSSGADICPL